MGTVDKEGLEEYATPKPTEEPPAPAPSTDATEDKGQDPPPVDLAGGEN